MGFVLQAGAIVVKDDGGVTKVLLVRAKKDPSRWIFPKGHIEPGESAVDAAARELKEEAGVIGSMNGPIGVSRFQSGEEQVEVTYYLGRFISTAEPTEVRTAQWLPLDEARRQLSFDDARKLLDQAALALPDRGE